MNKEATLIHFHGPKVGAIQAIVEEKWNWRSEHEQQIGSMFLGFIDSYLEAFEAIKEYFPELPAEESDRLSEATVSAKFLSKPAKMTAVGTRTKPVWIS